MVGIGIPGIILWVAILLIPFFRAFKAKMTFYKVFSITIMFMLFIANFAESAINTGNSIGAVYFWIAWVVAGKIYQFEKAASAEESAASDNAVYELTGRYPAAARIEN
jgi:hypothetical protein